MFYALYIACLVELGLTIISHFSLYTQWRPTGMDGPPHESLRGGGVFNVHCPPPLSFIPSLGLCMKSNSLLRWRQKLLREVEKSRVLCAWPDVPLAKFGLPPLYIT